MTHLVRRQAFHLIAWASLAICAAAPSAMAQAVYPSKPITLVVTYPPGGGADAMARLIAPKMGEALGQAIVIDNKPGAGGQIGAAAVAKAAPDGYTLMLDASSFAVNPSLYPKLPYDSAKAFQAVGIVALFPNVVLVNANFPAKNMAELMAAARKSKDAVSYASSGNGSAQHLAGALFESAAKVDMVHVPYKGGGPALNDVIGGQVPLFFGNLASTLQHVQSGKLKALAVTSGKRSPILPDVPTLSESGLKGTEIYEWNAVFAPANTPEPVMKKLASAFQQALESPDVKARVGQLGGEIQKGTPEQAKKFIEQQTSLWNRVIKERNITTE
ncbi:tripartite tricarboxylate transporter substrate binding protein [Limnohabitans sp. 2KL-1]|jgi:tripartite-type tricarboxylate transporter receptor subunit TctC|uniref:tripartite tricarboxylate transporter substrate binding protein n=2 Tax=Limnohabitans TaxID=665874 RepID=UPI000D3B14D7|nr:tripartite tricarboxylate transporter substrate binding protein [Limnohabitans sp.]